MSNYNTVESGNFHPFEDKNIRKTFIRKVYSLLFAQLLWTFGVGLFFNLYDKSIQFVNSDTGQGLFFLSIIGSFTTILILFCNPSTGRKSPSNYIILSLFTLFTSYMVGITTVYYNTQSVYVAFAITASVTIMLTIYAWQTKYDFTDKGGYLIAVLTGLIITGFLNIFIQNNFLQLICSGIGAILFSCYIVYDTQLIVGGNHRKYQYSEEDHVFAALTLYLDIINLFLYMLDLVGRGRR
jgi:protein lifeguard